MIRLQLLKTILHCRVTAYALPSSASSLPRHERGTQQHSHQRDVDKMVTVKLEDRPVGEALLEDELRRDLSKAMASEELLKGEPYTSDCLIIGSESMLRVLYLTKQRT